MRRMMTIFACLSAAMLASGTAGAFEKIAKVGVLTDYSGVYADLTGPGSELAAQMAAEDSGLRQKGWQLDVVVGDHLNKADVGAAIARKWMTPSTPSSKHRSSVLSRADKNLRACSCSLLTSIPLV